jgi:hypothetical protein
MHVYNLQNAAWSNPGVPIPSSEYCAKWINVNNILHADNKTGTNNIFNTVYCISLNLAFCFPQINMIIITIYNKKKKILISNIPCSSLLKWYENVPALFTNVNL